MQIPIGQSSTFAGIIDLIRGIAVYYNLKDEKDKGKTIIEKPIPEEDQEAASRSGARSLRKRPPSSMTT